MTYYPDLSVYAYSDDPMPMLNVGWLNRVHEFETGEVDEAAVNALLVLADQPRNVMRGYHYCEFCDEESPIRLAAPVERRYVSLGTGEIHVVGVDEVRYAAPTLLIHYIQAHGYRPPKEFLAALGPLTRDQQSSV